MIYDMKGEENRKWNIWFQRAAYIVMSAIVTVAFFIAIALALSSFFDRPPIHAENLNTTPEESFCPGDRFDMLNHITVDKPTILFGYVSVMDENSDYNYPVGSRVLEPRPHPHPSDFTQTIPWSVPSLPPGKYVRVLAIRGHNPEEDPIFVPMPFEIGDCNEHRN